MKVSVSKEMITHYQALCFECDFCEADNVDRVRVRRLVYAHAKATGHKVSIEKGTSTHYQAVEPPLAPDRGGLWHKYHKEQRRKACKIIKHIGTIS